MAGILILVLLVMGRGEAPPLGGNKELLHAEDLLSVALHRKKMSAGRKPSQEWGDWENHHHPDNPGESFQEAKLGKKEKKKKTTQIKRFCSMHLQDGLPQTGVSAVCAPAPRSANCRHRGQTEIPPESVSLNVISI